MYFKHILTLLFACMAIVGCNQDFYKLPNPNDRTSNNNPTNPWNPSGPNPAQPVAKLPPYDWADFKFSTWQNDINDEKIIPDPGPQLSPDIYENTICYVDRASSTDVLTLYNMSDKTLKTLPAGNGHSIWAPKIYKNTVAWIEHLLVNGKHQWEMYVATTPDLTQSTRKFNTFEFTSTNSDVYADRFKSFQVSDNAIFWAESKNTDQDYWNPTIFFYDLLTQTKHELIGMKSTHFKVMNHWLIYTTPRTNSMSFNINAYNLVTGEKRKLNSDASEASGSFVVNSNNLVLWIDERYTKTSIFSFDLNEENRTQEKQFLLFNSKGQASTLYSFQQNLLYLTPDSYNYLYVIDLNILAVHRIRHSMDQNNGLSFYKNNFILSYNDSLYKDNTDIFLGIIPQ